MKCPHCLESFHEEQSAWSVGAGTDVEAEWVLARTTCPACDKFVFFLVYGAKTGTNRQGVVGVQITALWGTTMVRPQGVARSPVSPEVPKDIAEDYREACLVLAVSPKASAALSRRCLQLLLRTAAGVKPRDLSNEIQEVLESNALPSALAESIDAVRVVGNFAAHPVKSKSTGEVVPVEPHEAGWNLDVLESLFDFYFVLPARIRAKRDALNKKSGDAGKPPLK
jgi:hypothetical protein